MRPLREENEDVNEIRIKMMCGIVGIFGKDTSALETKGLLGTIKHRGPDYAATYLGKGFAVGHVRLAINDLSEYSNQPFIKDDLIVLFNGEIYNTKVNGFYKELDFIVAAYKTGRNFKHLLEGQYVIVIIDLAKQIVTMVRDLWGIIPLYLGYDVEGRFIFGSEKRVLQAAKVVGISELAPNEMCEYEIQPRGTYLGWTDVEHGRRSLLNIGEFNPVVTLELLKDSIRKRCEHTDVGYSAALSGGLDSSLLVKLMVDMGMQVFAHTVSFEGGDDAKYASRLANELGVKHKVHYVTMEQILAELPKMLRHLEDPIPNIIKLLGYIRNYYVAKYSESKVVISGEGADELFAGYPFFKVTDTPVELSIKRQSAIKSMRAINLDRVDRGGMAWGKEYRMPYLDYQFAKYVMSCVVEPQKQTLKKLAKNLGIPDYIINRPKYGSDEKMFGQVFKQAKEMWKY